MYNDQDYSDEDEYEDFVSEDEVHDILRESDVEYKTISERVQTSNLFDQLISSLRDDGWNSFKIARTIKRFFNDYDRYDVWNYFRDQILNTLGLDDEHFTE